MKRIFQVSLIIVAFVSLVACGEQLPTVQQWTPVPDVDPAEEPVEEAGEEAAEEPAEEAVEEAAEVPAEESVEEAVEEPAEESVEEAAEAPAEESTEETAEETQQEAIAETEEVTAEEMAGGSLTGVIWNLTLLNGQPLVPETSITAEFDEEGGVGGSSGCNNYNAAYETDGSSITINSSPAAMTLMMCPEPIMVQETAYLQTLSSAATYEVSPENLTLFDADGSPIAVFDAVSQDLARSSWEVIGYNNGKGGVQSVIIDTQITVDFGEDGQLTGISGCNNYFGPYETDGENISIGPFGSTSMFCAQPEGIMEQEAAYLAALETAATFSFDGSTMNMRTAEGATVANFKRLASEEEALEESTDAQSELALTPEQITLDTTGLDTTWEAVAVPGTPYDQSMPPGPIGMPPHIQILFNGKTDPDEIFPSDPVMYIIPVNAYRQLWEVAGNDSITRSIQKIQDLNFLLPNPAPTSSYPALPFEQVGAGVNDVAVQVGRAVDQGTLNLTSATQNGYRFVGRWAQDANPVSNYGLRYVYQGFTNDGEYLVSFWWPVTTEALPDSGTLTPEEMETFAADHTTAINTIAEELNQLSADKWAPDLTSLDAVVASLEIESVPAAGLVEKTWEWVQGPAQPGSVDIVTVEDPSLYQATYGADGNLNFTADCNEGMMSFELTRTGMSGGMLTSPGPVTLALCVEGSLSESFTATLQAAQDYRVWAGGAEMELLLPADGGILLMRDADAPQQKSAPEVAVSGMVTNIDSAEIPEGATASIQIQDTSLADAPALVIGKQLIENSGPFPIEYQVAFDPENILDNHTYTMSARITAADGTLLFINDTAIPVITNDNPIEDVEIPVIQVGGTNTGAEGAAVSGEVTFEDSNALAEGSTVTVQIQDTSLADVPALVIGQQEITEAASFPIAYEVSYDSGQIVDNHTYTMSARISGADGSLLFINDTAIMVITNGNPTEGVEIPVILVSG